VAGTIETLPTSTWPAGHEPFAGAINGVADSGAPFAVPLYPMQPFAADGTGTYCLKIEKLFWLRPGSVAIAAKPAAVGAATAPPSTEM